MLCLLHVASISVCAYQLIIVMFVLCKVCEFVVFISLSLEWFIRKFADYNKLPVNCK